MSNPQLEDGFTPIANEVLEALCQVNLSPYESRLLWCIIRKTYGYRKKEDWIANSQLIAMTGLPKGSVSKAKARLLKRKIVTQTGNRIAFNKFYMQWDQLPIEVTHEKVTCTETIDTHRETKVSVERDTKETPTKETIQKKEPVTYEVLERDFRRLADEHGWCDVPYAEKFWSQGIAGANRDEFIRKVTLMVSWARIAKYEKRAKTLFHEISGFINDSILTGKLTLQEKQRRAEFVESQTDG